MRELYRAASYTSVTNGKKAEKKAAPLRSRFGLLRETGANYTNFMRRAPMPTAAKPNKASVPGRGTLPPPVLQVPFALAGPDAPVPEVQVIVTLKS
jgi:hypothetical protein